MGRLILHGLETSPSLRAVKLTLEALYLKYEYIEPDFSEDPQLWPYYLVNTPHHTVPTLEDDGHCLYDSHAVMAYLVSKYGRNDALYPRDLVDRATVDEMLFFETASVYQDVIHNITVPILFWNENKVPQWQIDKVLQVYDTIENVLSRGRYMAGDKMTIADFSLISSISSLNAIVPVDGGKFPKLTAWIWCLEQLPYYEANGKGARAYQNLIRSKSIVIE